MDYNENEYDTESDEEENNENESSGSDENETGDESGDSDDDSDYESVEEVIDTVSGERENGESLKAFSSDDDPERENCPVCLNKFIGQDLGSPESCDHTFCFECIKEWSKNINTCPIDRTEFNYIHVKNSSDGSVVRKVKVKVSPKEPEDALEEHPTLCEICRSSDREDRLLLCDGCDLAYHCECLDPPLFYIPIDEWFCSSCSGVFDRRAAAGPSRSFTRRIIPRTRASETVRSRVQNLRSARTPRSPSTSTRKKTNTQGTTKKRKRRSYRKVIRKVVTLARTKKDMNAGGKGKVGARSSAVIVTYRARRRRRRRKTKKASKRSVTSSKGSSIPSSKLRIARHLGMAKPLKGSTVPQIKKSSGSKSHSTSVKIGLPSHSIFGNKHQLMDFSENFNEDERDTSSNPPQRSLTDPGPSTSSGINILDSIMEGQKILHAKSDKILIKTDGSLILKEDTKRQNSVRNVERDQSSRTPMSIALAKQGVRTLLSDKNLSASCKKHADTTKTKNVSHRRTLQPSVSKVPSNSSSKLFKILSNGVKNSSDDERKKSLSAAKNSLGIKTNKVIVSETVDPSSFTELDGFSNDIPSIRETVLPNNNRTNHSSAASNIKNQNYVKLEKCDNSIKNYHTKFDSLSDNLNTTLSLLSSTTSHEIPTGSSVKKEILSDKEANNNSPTTDIEKIRIKEEILSDEETNIDSWNNHTINGEQECSSVLTNIKKEPIESNLNVDAIKDRRNLELSRNTLSENDLSDCDASQSIIDSVSCDVLNASQINKVCKITKLVKVKEEVLSDTENCSQSLLLDNISEKFNKLSKLKNSSIKTEPFDSSDDNKSPEKENIYHKNKRPSIERLESRNTTFLSKNACHSSKNDLYNKLPCTQAAVTPLSNSESEDDLPCTQAVAPLSNSESEDDSSDDDKSPEKENIYHKNKRPSIERLESRNTTFLSKNASQSSKNGLYNKQPCTQAVASLSNSESEDDDIPCTQAVAPLSNSNSESEDDDIPCTQALAPLSNYNSESEDDDIPCTQAVAPQSNYNSESEDDDIPCTQAVAPLSNSESEDDDIPCTQAVAPLSNSESEDDIPCTQAFPQAVSSDSEDDIPSTQALPAIGFKDNEIVCTQTSPRSATNFENDSLPCTQAIFNNSANSEDEDDDIPCTQPAFISSKNISTKCNALSSFDANKVNSSKVSDNLLPPTQNVLHMSKNRDSDTQVSSTKIDFDFKKPSAISIKKVFPVKDSNKYNKTSSRVSLMSSLSECELPSTQAATFSPSINKDESSNEIFNNLKSVKNIKARHNFDVNDSEDSSLPLTQVFSSKQISNLSDTAGMNSNLKQTFTKKNIPDSQLSSPSSESFDLPPTQISRMPSKKQNASCLADDQSFLLPNTQAMDNLTHRINFSKDNESVDLIRKELGSQTNDIDNNQDFLPDTQVLPDTQIVSSNSKNLETIDTSDEQNSNICKKDLTEIISNIKQLVNNLSSNVSDNKKGQNIQNEISNDKLLPNSSNNTTSNDSRNLNKTAGSNNVSAEEKSMQSNNSKDVLSEGSKKSSLINNDKKNQNSASSSDESDNEEFCLEKFKESLKKPNTATPKKSGVHKHLPQVITTVPVKENLKIKPSNKRTFSFEEVKKLQGLDVKQKSPKYASSKFENSESDSDLNDSLPATQVVETVNNKQCKSKLLQLRTKKHLNEKPSFQTCTSPAHENDSFPATQVMISQTTEKDIKSSENNDSESMHFNSSLQNMNWKGKQKSNKKYSVPTADIHTTKKRDFSHLSNTTEDELSDSPITQRNKAFPSHNKNIKRKNNSGINKSKKELVTSELDLNINTDSTVDYTDINDLPATQVCDNLAFINTDAMQESSVDSTETPDIENHQNNAFKRNRKLENHHFTNSSTSKRKNSFDGIIQNKKACKQIENKSISKNDNTNINEQRNVNRCLETPHEKSESKITNNVGNLFSSNCKQKNATCDKNLKLKKHINHSETALSSEVNDLLKSYKKTIIKCEKNDSEFVKPSVNVQTVDSSTANPCLNLNAIKTEKLDPSDDFLPPANFNHSENDSLPQTQVTASDLVNIDRNIDEQNNSISIQDNFLLPSTIKKEPYYDDDDEVSIIELDATSSVQVKEIIQIDDDNYDTNLSDSHIKQEKEIPSEVVDVSCIKREKCLGANASLEIEPEIEMISNTYRKSVPIPKEYKEKDDDSAKSNLDCQNHNNVEPIKSKRNSTESGTSKENIETSKNHLPSKEKIIKNSFDRHTSEGKGKSNLKDLVSGEKNTTLKDFSQNRGKDVKKKDSYSKDSKASKRETKNSHNSHGSNEKSRKELKDPFSSEKEIRQKSLDSHVTHKKGDKINKTDVLKSQHKNKTDSVIDSTSEGKRKVDKCMSLFKSIHSSPKYSGTTKHSLDSSKSANDQYEVVTNKIETDKQGNFERENNKHSKKKLEEKSIKDRRENNKHSKEITLEEKSKKSDKDRRENNKHSKVTSEEKSKKSDKDRRENNHHSKEVILEEKSKKSDKDRRCSSEKENRNKDNNKEVIITIKPVNKRSYNDTSEQHNQKKRKTGHSLDSESNSSDDIDIQLSDLHNNFHHKHTDLNGGISNRLSMPKDREKISEFNEIFAKLPQTTDIKKVRSKQDLKEEIAHEVKLVLKPFYSTGLISKDDYKDIMRRAVPKIYMNCHHLINPEKIRKLILNYVSLLNKS